MKATQFKCHEHRIIKTFIMLQTEIKLGVALAFIE
jgi:hypothetical protein